MPGTTDGRWDLPYMLGVDQANTIDTTSQALAEKLRDEGMRFSQGSLASRPPSTPGEPGKPGQVYYATDTGEYYYDFGTGWRLSLSDAHAAQLGLNAGGVVRRGKAIIPAEQSISGGSAQLMATPDRVQGIVVPADGLLFIKYSALVKSQNSSEGTAQIFVNGVGPARPSGTGAPVGIGWSGFSGTANDYDWIFTAPNSTNAPIALATLGGAGNASRTAGAFYAGDFIAIEPPAGTYDVEVRYAGTGGGSVVTAKERKLFVKAEAY